MKDLFIEATKSTPHVNFNAGSGLLKIQGESFPENAGKFYSPVLEWLKGYLGNSPKKTILEMEIIYFNSSTSKIFLTIFDFLEKEVISGKDIEVHWRCSEENEIAIECGEEFQEDLTDLPFKIILI